MLEKAQTEADRRYPYPKAPPLWTGGLAAFLAAVLLSIFARLAELPDRHALLPLASLSLVVGLIAFFDCRQKIRRHSEAYDEALGRAVDERQRQS